MKLSNLNENNENDLDIEKNDLFTNYIIGLLKRDADLPLIKTNFNDNQIDETELNHMIRNVLNLIKIEYIERQQRAILEFQKRFNFFYIFIF